MIHRIIAIHRLVVVSLICIASGGKQQSQQLPQQYEMAEEIPTDEEESAHLINEREKSASYDALGQKSPPSVADKDSVQ